MRKVLVVKFVPIFASQAVSRVVPASVAASDVLSQAYELELCRLVFHIGLWVNECFHVKELGVLKEFVHLPTLVREPLNMENEDLREVAQLDEVLCLSLLVALLAFVPVVRVEGANFEVSLEALLEGAFQAHR